MSWQGIRNLLNNNQGVVDVALFLIGVGPSFIIGLLVENKWKICQKFQTRIKQKIKISSKLSFFSFFNNWNWFNSWFNFGNKKKGQEKVAQKGEGNQANQATNSPNSPSQNFSINNSPGASINADLPRVGTEEEVLGQPKEIGPTSGLVPVLEGDKEFIYKEIKTFFERNGKQYNLIDNYRRAEMHRGKSEYRSAATLYIRAFSPFLRLLNSLGNYKNVVISLQIGIDRLDSWSSTGSGENFEEIIGNINGIIYKFFQEDR